MSDEERSPLLAPKGKGKDTSGDSISESTPLLSGATSTPRYDGEDDAHDGQLEPTASERSASRASSRRSTRHKGAGWPSIIAGAILLILTVTIMLVAFFVPAAVEEYAKQAAVLEPTNLSLESITADGLRARIQANFRLDASRVQEDTPRRIGRVTMWIVRKLGTEQTQVAVYLPQYDNVLLGTATLPPLTVDVVDGHNTIIDIVADIVPGEAENIRTIANQWLEGKLDQVRLVGKADIPLKTGVIPLGTHSVAESLVVEANNMPALPAYNITRLTFRDVPAPGGKKQAVGAEVTITTYNKYPVQLDIPELGFEILVPNCNANDPFIPVAEAVTSPVAVTPCANVSVNAHAIIGEIPEPLTRECPESGPSPLDKFLKHYMNGEEAKVFVRGRKIPDSDTPEWITDILSSITVPVPFPGRSFDNLIKNFSLTDVDFQLPSPFTPPNSPDANPKVSGTIEVLATLPTELNLDLNVTDIKAFANVTYRGEKFGELDLEEWQKAKSVRVKDEETHEAVLLIKSRIKDAPLTITDGDVFAEVVQELLLGDDDIILGVVASVAVRVKTVLGTLTLKDVPTEGKIPVKHLPGSGLGELQPSVGDVRVLGTTETAIHIEALVNISNPTPYTAHIPYLTIHVLKNDSLVGEATVRDIDITTGNNTNVLVSAVWEPAKGGSKARKVGVDLISQYLSGYNTTVEIRTHKGSIPTAPLIGAALSKIHLHVSAPRLNLPSDDPDDSERFIRDATFHFFSSTATFTLVSPFKHDTLFLDWVNATAYYNHTHPVGHIENDKPFSAPPGASETPRLPVEWSVDSVGYEAVKKALGGQLKLDAKADVTLRLGKFRETIWYVGRGIGAHIRP